MFHLRAFGTSYPPARISLRRALGAGAVVLAVTATAVPLGAAAAAAPAPGTAWGHHATATAGKVPAGVNHPRASVAADRTHHQAARKRSTAAAGDVSPMVYVPEGQGAVPWHRISDTRLTDALVARVDVSSGNLMLVGTDFDIAGVGQKLQFAHTYNSFDTPVGAVSKPWWQTYERNLESFSSDVVLYDSSGATVDFTTNADGTYTTPAGYSQDLVKNGDGTFTLTDRKSGSKDTYNSAGTLTKVTDRNGGVITMAAHTDGFKLTETRSGRWIDWTKPSALQWKAVDSTGRTAVYDLDGAGNLAKTTDTTGKATLYGYDASNRVNQVTTPEGGIAKFAYDSQSRITSFQRVANPDGTGPTWLYDYSATYPSQAGTTTVTDPDGDKTAYVHDDTGQVTKVTDPLTHAKSTTYDTNHNVKTAVDAMGVGSTPGNTTIYGWDTRNNPTSAQKPTGATSAFSGYATIAGADLPGAFTSADGNKTSFTYDTAGNTKSVATTGTGGATRSYTYNPATPTCGGFTGQRCTAVDGNGKTTAFTYDTQGNLTKAAPPAPAGASTYTYDALGRPATATDGRGIKVLYTYDDRDRLIKADTASYATVTYTYDGDGNVRKRTDPSGTTTYTPDKLNRESLRTLTDGSQTLLTYTPDGSVDTYTDPTGLVDYTYDHAGRLTQLTDPASKTTVYGYNNNDAPTTTTYPGGTVQTVTLDASDRPKAIKTVNGATTLVNLAYTYGYTAGTATKDGSVIRTRTDSAAGTTTAYTYDAQARLTYAKETAGSTVKASWLYCFYANGNLGQQSTTAAACPGTTAYTYNDASQLITKDGATTGWSYDKAGNETAGASTATPRTAEAWSDYSQLKSITQGGTTYTATYSGTDNSERTKLGSTTFHNGPEGLAASTTAGTDTGFIRLPAGSLNSMRTGGKSYYYLTDAQGSVLGLVDDAGNRTHTYSYTPTGLDRTTPVQAVPQPYRFQGTYLDPTGLYKMGARYYDPTLGRFTQTDPSGKEKNPYLFAAGDPINHTDPTGKYSVSDFETDIGFIGSTTTIGAAAGGTIGSIFPVVGTTVGGVAGGAGGIAFGVGFLAGEYLT